MEESTRVIAGAWCEGPYCDTYTAYDGRKRLGTASKSDPMGTGTAPTSASRQRSSWNSETTITPAAWMGAAHVGPGWRKEGGGVFSNRKRFGRPDAWWLGAGSV